MLPPKPTDPGQVFDCFLQLLGLLERLRRFRANASEKIYTELIQEESNDDDITLLPSTKIIFRDKAHRKRHWSPVSGLLQQSIPPPYDRSSQPVERHVTEYAADSDLAIMLSAIDDFHICKSLEIAVPSEAADCPSLMEEIKRLQKTSSGDSQQDASRSSDEFPIKKSIPHKTSQPAKESLWISSYWYVWLDHSLDHLRGRCALNLRLQRFENWCEAYESNLARHFFGDSESKSDNRAHFSGALSKFDFNLRHSIKRALKDRFEALVVFNASAMAPLVFDAWGSDTPEGSDDEGLTRSDRFDHGDWALDREALYERHCRTIVPRRGPKLRPQGIPKVFQPGICSYSDGLGIPR